MGKLAKALELYKCAVLTVIAVLLAATWLKTPCKTVGKDQVPLVYVRGGSIDVDNTVDVDVKNTVDVEGEVSIRR